MAFSKTRIAPTSSGYLHVGNVLSFALTAALAEKNGARTLLRIDDLDRDRIQTAYVQDVFDTLNFLEIPWHEGPRDVKEFQAEWSQVHRLVHYNNLLERLKASARVFACTCSRAQLRNAVAYPGTCRHKHIPLDADNVNWRLRTDDRLLQMQTLDQGALVSPLPPEAQDFVVRKKDRFPAYQLASVADDLHFGVDLVVRGRDLWASTLAQLFIADVLQLTSFQQATFYHHPLLMENGVRKLSKSAGSTSVRYLRQEGKTAAEVYRIIGQMLGLPEPVNNWQDVGALLM